MVHVFPHWLRQAFLCNIMLLILESAINIYGDYGTYKLSIHYLALFSNTKTLSTICVQIWTRGETSKNLKVRSVRLLKTFIILSLHLDHLHCSVSIIIFSLNILTDSSSAQLIYHCAFPQHFFISSVHVC